MEFARFSFEFILVIAFGEIVKVLANFMLARIGCVETFAEVRTPRVLRSDCERCLHLIMIAGSQAANFLILLNGARIVLLAHS